MNYYYTTLISAESLNAALFANNLLIVDCRFYLNDTELGRNEFNESHLPKSIYAHLDEDLSGKIVPGITGRHPFPDIDTLKATFSKWGLDENVQVIAFDHSHGGIAARLWFLLKWLGHENVAVLDGGWSTWTKKGFPVTTDKLEVSPKEFKVDLSQDWVVDANFLQTVIHNKNWKICDSRTADRFRGENETIDPVAGHIPGALSIPFIENLNEQGEMESTEKLIERFDSKLQNHPMEQTVFYCGSGVTACQNLLTLQHIGKKGAKIYPGSWSDWITDKSRPIETGD